MVKMVLFWSSDVLSESKTVEREVEPLEQFWSSDVLSESKTQRVYSLHPCGFGAATF